MGDFTSNRAFFTKTKDLPELGFIGDTESALGGYLSSVLSTLTLSNRDPLNFYKENRKRLKSLALALPENPVRKMFIDRVESFR